MHSLYLPLCNVVHIHTGRVIKPYTQYSTPPIIRISGLSQCQSTFTVFEYLVMDLQEGTSVIQPHPPPQDIG